MTERDSYAPGTPCWVDLGTTDLEGAKAFYGGLFGWHAHTSPAPEAGGYTMLTLDGDESRPIAAMMPVQAQGQPVAWTTYVSVADADATVKAAQGAGGQLLMGPMDVMDQGRMALFADPEGAVMGIWRPGAFAGARVVNEPGTFCWTELATRDVNGSKAFYRAVFGWEGETHAFGRTSYTEWRVGDGPEFGGMLEMDDSWPPGVPPHWLVYFAVADTDATAARAAELGGAVPVPPNDIQPGRFAVLNDPQGGYFAVIRLNV